MFFSEKSDLIDLDFSPAKTSVRCARIEWRGVILNPQAPQSHPIVDVSDQALASVFLDLFPELSFMEQVQLFEVCENQVRLAPFVHWEFYFNAQNQQWNPRAESLFKKCTELPQAFRSWAIEKKISFNDILPILGLEDLTEFNKLTPSIVEKRLSRNEGKQVIDLLVDLLLMQKAPSVLQPVAEKPWITQLQMLRNPQSFQREDRTTDGWPQYVQITKFRQGDRRMEKMQITYKDQEDLHEKLQRLSQLKSQDI